jgi:hypothetical protein
MTAKELQKLEDQNQKKRTENIKKIGHRFENYRKLLWKWIVVYILVYIFWSLFEYFFVNWEWFKEIVKNRANWLRELILLIVEFILAFLRGRLYSFDGEITSQLKSPFGQICFFINKNEEIDEETKDKMIEKITESNEHCKETFKKFGMLSIAGETAKILVKMNLDEETSLSPRTLGFYLVMMRTKIVPLLSYLVPIYYSNKQIRNISKDLEKIQKSLSSN